MGVQQAHTKLLTAAAREVFRPLGLAQKGRSRTWLDDQGWWLGVVEFQPSSWSRGSYLNVGVNWLWNVRDYLSFDQGGRVHLDDDGQFVSYDDDAQFAEQAGRLVSRAAEEIASQRERFHTLDRAASTMRSTSIDDLLGIGSGGHDGQRPRRGGSRSYECGQRCPPPRMSAASLGLQAEVVHRWLGVALPAALAQ